MGLTQGLVGEDKLQTTPYQTIICLHFPLKAVARSHQSSGSFPEWSESPEWDVGCVSPKNSYLKGSFVIRLTITKMPLGFSGGSAVKNPFRSLDWEGPLEESMATHSSILSWEIHGQRSLVGCGACGCKKSDATEATEHGHTVYIKSALAGAS